MNHVLASYQGGGIFVPASAVAVNILSCVFSSNIAYAVRIATILTTPHSPFPSRPAESDTHTLTHHALTARHATARHTAPKANGCVDFPTAARTLRTAQGAAIYNEGNHMMLYKVSFLNTPVTTQSTIFNGGTIMWVCQLGYYQPWTGSYGTQNGVLSLLARPECAAECLFASGVLRAHRKAQLLHVRTASVRPRLLRQLNRPPECDMQWAVHHRSLLRA
jgi:hypothetical protein